MKNSNFFFVYITFLLIFFWRTILFWFSHRYMGGEGTDILLYIALVVVEVLSLSLILFTKKLHRRHDNWIHALCLGWELLSLIVLLYNNAPIGHYPKVLAWPLFFESAYLIVKSDFRRVKSFKKAYYLVLLFGGYVFTSSMIMNQFGSQTNMVYFLVLPIPIILLYCPPKWRNRILFLTSFFCLLSMKRSMMLAIALFWAIYGFKLFFSRGKKILALGMSLIFLTVAYVSVEAVDKISSGGLSIRTIDYEKEDITNGREAIYEITWNMIVQSPMIHLILGHGHNSVRTDSPLGISAHNDFMEIIYDYGLIALLIYLGLWLYLVKQFVFHYRKDTMYFIPYTLSVCFFMVMAIVSQLVVYVNYFLYLVMFWGIVQADKERILLNKKYERSLLNIR